MKKLSYILGIISICIILTGTIFKSLHLPGAAILLTVGIGSISLIFLPITYIMLLKNTNDKLLKWVYHTAFISFFIDFVGMLFKIMHWPGAAKFLIIGVPLPFILFLPTYILYHNKRKLKIDANFMGIILFMIYLGVFSSMLALNFSYSFLNSYTQLAKTINCENHLLLKQLPNNSKSLHLINQLETVKTKITLMADKENQSYIKDNSISNYAEILGKDKKLGNATCMLKEFTDFNHSFESFKKEVSISNNPMNQKLIHDIDTYRLPQNGNEFIELERLPLINILNLLSDWQNKILLMDYLSKP